MRSNSRSMVRNEKPLEREPSRGTIEKQRSIANIKRQPSRSQMRKTPTSSSFFNDNSTPCCLHPHEDDDYENKENQRRNSKSEREPFSPKANWAGSLRGGEIHSDKQHPGKERNGSRRDHGRRRS